MSASAQLTGQFESMAAVHQAAEKLRAAGIAEYEVYSPVLHHEEMEEEMPRRGSPVHFVSWGGGLSGIAIGLGMCILASMLYYLVVGGKPAVALVPYIVIAYECTILFAALATVGALFWFARLKPLAPPAGYDPRFSGDRYGITVQCEENQKGTAARVLKAAGAVAVTEGEGTSV